MQDILRSLRSRFEWPRPAAHGDGALTYRRDIDGLHALAVLSVVGYHAFPQWVQGGFVGVDVFFVISGFLIGSILYKDLLNGSFQFLRFYARRILRIFPALLIVLISCLALGWVYLPAKDYKNLAEHAAWSAMFMSNMLLQRQAGYFDEASISKPLLHLWSLAIEEQFYLVFPLFLFVVFKEKWLFLTATASLTALSLVALFSWGQQDASATYYSPVTRYWELMCGALLAYQKINAGQHRVPARINAWFPPAGIACIFLAIFTPKPEEAFPFLQILSAITGAAMLIAAKPDNILSRHFLSNRVMVGLGLISYPLYLWHWPLISFLHATSSEPVSGVSLLALIGTSTLLAWLTYFFIEKPIRNGKRQNIKSQALLMLMLSALYSGSYIFAQNGFPGRFIKPIAELLETDFTYNYKWRQSRCFLEAHEQKRGHFLPECTRNWRKPSIVIWGDSAAAMLYPGLKWLALQKNYSISQYTSSRCPPLVDYTREDRPYCKYLNDGIIKKIAKTNPDYVVLAGNWADRSYDLNKLKATINRLKKHNNPNVILIGQFPIWPKPLPMILFQKWRKDILKQIPEPYQKAGVYMPKELDSELKELSESLGSQYISAVEKMCVDNACIAYFYHNNKYKLAYVDVLHISPTASIYFANSIADYFSQ